MIQKTFILLLALLSWQLQAQKVTNVTAKQEGKKIIVNYKIEGGRTDRVYSPILYYSTDGGTNFTKCHSTKANYGKPNQTNEITWNVTNDLDYFGKDNIVFKVNAYGFWNFVKGTANLGGRTYNTIKIGQQEWMAENLDLDVGSGCYCYDNNSANCQTYGRLYTWEAAKTAAGKIPGWHLPGDAEWDQLVNFLGGDRSAGNKLKSTSGWQSGGNGTNSSGFCALPGGYRYYYGSFDYRGIYAYFWSATPNGSSYAWRRKLNYSSSKVYRYYDYRKDAYSVRVVRD